MWNTVNIPNCYYHLFLYKVKQQIFVLVQKKYRASLVTQMVKNLPAMREKVKGKSLSCVWLIATPWTHLYNAPGQNTGVCSLSLLQRIFPIQGLNLGIELRSSALRADSLPIELSGKPCNVGDPGSFPGWGRLPWRRECLPTPVFLPGKSHGQRSLAGYSPPGCKEPDTLSNFHFFLKTYKGPWIYYFFSKFGVGSDSWGKPKN